MKTRPKAYGLYDPRNEHDSCGVGFVAHIRKQRSHSIVDDAKQLLINMTHRGAVGSDRNTGDGAGILTVLPERFIERIAAEELGSTLPDRGRYSAGVVFLPTDGGERDECKSHFERVIRSEGQRVIGWRTVPRDNSMIGPTARESEPDMEQVFIAASDESDDEAFERALYLIRKRAQSSIRGGVHDRDSMFYICSLSTRVMVYKGMLMPDQLFRYFLDLAEPDYETHLALVHSRFSTNTFPSWDRAQPLRFMSHNGEINTLRGNVNKMRAREGVLESGLFGESLQRAFPVIEPDLSDSGTFDNVLELLLLSGRSLQEAVMMMIPEAWQNHSLMSDRKKAMYEYYSTLMEPWDGPASIAFTDGHVIGAVLDRNGLRPSRYYVTEDDRVIMASEAGVLDIEPEKVRIKGRLQPGRMFLVDFDEGRLVPDEELKDKLAASNPYRSWIEEQRITLDEVPSPHAGRPAERMDEIGSVNAAPAGSPSGNGSAERADSGREDLFARLRAFGYTVEHLNMILGPMAEKAKEQLGSMGNDTPLAALSEHPRLLYEYFKQLFAQVTNPPIDSIREELIMSLSSYIGPQGNLLTITPEHARMLKLEHPVLTNDELERIKRMNYRGWRSKTVDITYRRADGLDGFLAALDRIADESEQAISDGYSLVVLSDRDASRERIALSALLATGTVHHHLVRKAKRTQVGLVVESGEPRETHHFCCLVGYGADAINPYLAFEAMWYLRDSGHFAADLGDSEIEERYIHALSYGMRKVFGKMGISTLDSYKGAQIFEAIGLKSEVVERSFAGTATRVEGVGFDILAREAEMRHELAYPDGNIPIGGEFHNPGDYQWRHGGEKHMWDPDSVARMQIAARRKDWGAYREFADHQDARSKQQATLRGLLKFVENTDAVALDEVEPASEIVKRFATGAMSFGSISQEAHETLAIAMNRLGGKSNTGEGGELRERYRPMPNGDSKRSAIKQVASGRFGVTIEYLTESDELQIKMAQGAKPGEGGELPGHKVFDVIAKVRYSTPGVGLISPPPHHDIYSIEDLAQLIFDLKNANPQARISVKLVSEVGVGTVAAGVAKAHADHILISGHDGGTGASALTGIKHAGLPWELGLAETHQTLVKNGLRTRVVVQTDGQIKTGRDLAIAAMLGAEECGFATGALVAAGCIMMRVCHKNTCPVGIATQDERLRKKFSGKPEDVVNYLTFVAEDLRLIMARLGVRTYNELVGRSDLLEVDESVRNWKSRDIDLSSLLVRPPPEGGDDRVYCCIGQDHGISTVLDRSFIDEVDRSFLPGRSITLDYPIRNTDRCTGGMLSHHLVKQYGVGGVPDGSVHVKLTGSAGQSFGAWLTEGVTLELEGDANDYVGKGLSGGRLIVYPPRLSPFASEENIIIGNVGLYGATSGEGYFRGMAAERFCVRNSGASVVVEGVGDHGCEYMTGGRAVILGETGRNFGAGMSGGIAYVWDPDGRLAPRTNRGLVELYELDDEDETEVLALIRSHLEYTGSEIARAILEAWDERRGEFTKVSSPTFLKVLQSRKAAQQEAVHG